MLLPIVSCSSGTGDIDLGAGRCYHLSVTLKEREGMLPSSLAVYPNNGIESGLHSSSQNNGKHNTINYQQQIIIPFMEYLICIGNVT